MEKKKTLLQKYEIPIGHLDFAYIATCNDAREMEKILTILRSGEEGYYPDLTKTAEDKLRALNPRSKLFRSEQQVLGRNFLTPNEWKPIYDWTQKMRANERRVFDVRTALEMNPYLNEMDLFAQPIRANGRISSINNKNCNNNNMVATIKGVPKNCNKTASTDYVKWDKYDADEEIIRMELDEERVKEEVERKNRINTFKTAEADRLSEIDAQTQKTDYLHLDSIQRERLAENFRMRGNDHYRIKEFKTAIIEYSRSIRMSPTTAASAYNNRAMTYIKMRKYCEAIEDCKCCLKLDPRNMKAQLRLAECNCFLGNKREALDAFKKAIEIDPTNAFALTAAKKLCEEFGENPAFGGTRLHITEEIIPKSSEDAEPKPKSQENNKPTKALEIKQSTSNPEKTDKPTIITQYDLASLVVPNHLVASKFAAAAGVLNKLRQGVNQPNANTPNLPIAPALPLSPNGGANSMGKVFVEEI